MIDNPLAKEEVTPSMCAALSASASVNFLYGDRDFERQRRASSLSFSTWSFTSWRLPIFTVEWKSRFSLVENHNHELQELLEKLTTDQTAINEANLAAISALDATLGEDFDDLALEEIGELEDYAADDEDIEEFDVEDEE